jgi:hypothetical protein
MIAGKGAFPPGGLLIATVKSIVLSLVPAVMVSWLFEKELRRIGGFGGLFIVREFGTVLGAVAFDMSSRPDFG